MNYTRLHRNPPTLLLQSSTAILRTNFTITLAKALHATLNLSVHTMCRAVLGQEDALTNCLLFRFHVSAFRFEFMFWKAKGD